MDNKQVIDTLIACGKLEDIKFNIETLYKTDIDIRAWLKLGDKYKVSTEKMLYTLFNLVATGNDKDKEGVRRFFISFDFLFSLFSNRHISNSMDFMDSWAAAVSGRLNHLYRVFEYYDKDCGKELTIHGKKYDMVVENDLLNLYNKKNGKLEYKNVEGVIKDLITGEVTVVKNDEKDNGYYKIMEKDNNKFKVLL